MSDETRARRGAEGGGAEEALLARLLAEEGFSYTAADVIPRRPAGGAPPLSFAQQRLWFLDRLLPGNPAYNVAMAFRARGRLNVAALGQSLNEVIRRHEVLRTTFPAVDGSPVQEVAPALRLRLSAVSLEALPPPEREREAARLAAAEALRSFDLSRDALLRMTLLRLDADSHIVLFTMHHIVSDGWSKGVLTRELAALHAACAGGAPFALPELPIQYADFALWQRQALQGERLEGLLDYWRRQLAGPLPVLELSPGGRRGAVRHTARCAARALALPDPLTASLAALSRREGATLFMTLLAGFQALLYRYAGQEDILVGSPIANRNRPETEGLIGFFANTLVLRTSLAGDPTFRELLGRVRAAAPGAYEHEDLPFDLLVQELRPDARAGGVPLFQVMFAHDNAPRQEARLGELSLTAWNPEEAEAGAAWLDLVLCVKEAGSGLIGEFTYNAELFDAGFIRRMGAHFQRLLEAAAHSPDQRVAEVTLTTEAERHRLLVEWGGAAAGPAAAAAALPGLFARRAGASPDAVAVAVGGECLSYGELNARANRLARYLRRRGVGPEVLVGLCVERSLEMIVGILGILKAGGGYVPLDPSYPRERLAFMLEDAGAPLLLAQEHLLAGLPQGGAETVCLERVRDEAGREVSGNPAVEVRGGNTAYVIYTSGSTGRPKGVAVSHANVARLFDTTAPQFNFDARDVWTMFHSYAFDFSVWEFWGAFLYGGRLVVPAAAERDAESFRRLLADEQVTVLNQTPSAFSHLMQADASAGEGRLALRYVVFGGEALDPQGLRPWVARRGDARPRLVNMYGITETTVHVTYYPVTEADTAGGGSVVGRPIGDLSCYLLDARRQPVPLGAAGEIYVGGGGLARGYLNRPGLTAERFTPDPFSTRPGARLYRTGDLARHLPDGNLEYLGRIDQQVKLRGQRIELGEIEAALARHPAVREAAVAAREFAPGDTRLVAYLVADPARAAGARRLAGFDRRGRWESIEVLVGEVREALRGELPEYMVPGAYVALDSLPLTPSGKLDRKALPTPEAWEVGRVGGYVAPSTAVEAEVAGVWAEVLGVARVGVRENFFDLGGHSLLAARLTWRLRELFGLDLPLRRLLEGATVAELAETIESGLRAGAGAPPPIERAARDGVLPASFAQQRFWLMDQLEPGSDSYNIPVAVRLRGRLDIAALEQCLAEIVRRHESLRTRLVERDGRPAQVIEAPRAPRLPVADLAGLTPERRAEEARRRADEEARRPFDLARGPLLRARLLRLGPSEHDLLLTMHHVVGDGWSAQLLTREVSSLYPAYCAGGPSSLPEPSVQYADYAAWQRVWLSGEVLAEQTAYWERQLRAMPDDLKLPTDRPASMPRAARAAHRSFPLGQTLSEELKGLGRRAGATLYMTLLAGLQALLHRYAGQEEIAVGTGSAGRDRAETEGLIGCFFNLLIINTNLSGRPSFRELLGRVREVTLGAFAHQHVPFDQVLRALGRERDAARWSPFRALFEFQPEAPDVAGLPGLTLEVLEPAGRAPKFDLSLFVRDTGRGLVGTFEYDPNLFDADTVETLCDNLRALLEGAAADPDRPLAELPLPGCPDQHELIESFSEYIEEV